MNDENGEKIVELSKNVHICEPELYEKVMQKLNPDFIEKPNYEIRNDGKNLIVYTNIENTTGYEFYRCNKKNTFYCKTCKYDYDRHISANEVEKDGRTVLRMNKHDCKPIKFRLDLSEIEQSDLIWPKANEGNREYEELMTKMRLIHPIGICSLEAVTYVIHNAPPGSSMEKIASCILYVGYSEDYKKRFTNHLRTDGTVAKLSRKYGEVFLIPIFYDIPSACCDLEYIGHGSLHLPLQNLNKCSWKSSKEEGGFRIIAENPDHPDHSNLVLGVKKLIITAIADAPKKMISSRKLKPC
uniref:GIY-YIG domain-containing protein n=1 Tax=Panagrolaimus davidi TaxID=227884 RepID=A0A914R2P0_9BILA